MREDLRLLAGWIERADLPVDGVSLFGPAWSEVERRFTVQETYILDYKDSVPTKFSDGYGSGIIRLLLAMYNSYGGLIVFGVTDREQTVCGVTRTLDVEALNRVVSDVSGRSIECLCRSYTLPGLEEKDVCVLLVPKRGGSRPVKRCSNWAAICQVSFGFVIVMKS